MILFRRRRRKPDYSFDRPMIICEVVPQKRLRTGLLVRFSDGKVRRLVVDESTRSEFDCVLDAPGTRWEDV